MDKTKLLIAAAVLVVIILLITGFFYITGRPSTKADLKAQNTLRLASEYVSSGEYDMALNLINSLLIDNADNSDARTLRDEIIAKKKDQEASNKLLKDQKEEEARKAQDTLTQSLSELGNTIEDSSTTSISQADEAARRNAELKKLEEQRLAAEKKRKEEEARLAALSQAERNKAEEVKKLIQTGKDRMQEISMHRPEVFLKKLWGWILILQKHMRRQESLIFRKMKIVSRI